MAVIGQNHRCPRKTKEVAPVTGGILHPNVAEEQGGGARMTYGAGRMTGEEMTEVLWDQRINAAGAVVGVIRFTIIFILIQNS